MGDLEAELDAAAQRGAYAGDEVTAYLQGLRDALKALEDVEPVEFKWCNETHVDGFKTIGACEQAIREVARRRGFKL